MTYGQDEQIVQYGISFLRRRDLNHIHFANLGDFILNWNLPFLEVIEIHEILSL